MAHAAGVSRPTSCSIILSDGLTVGFFPIGLLLHLCQIDRLFMCLMSVIAADPPNHADQRDGEQRVRFRSLLFSLFSFFLILLIITLTYYLFGEHLFKKKELIF